MTSTGDKPASRETPVLIVGAGPIGLTTAMDLAWRGVPVVVAEIRSPDDPRDAKSNHISARSMEIFRRLGVAKKLRAAGLPPDHPSDVTLCTTITGIEIARIPIPGSLDSYAATATDSPAGAWPTAEPLHHINQTFMEPILLDHAAAMPGVTLFDYTRIEDFVQDDDGVTATARDLASDATFTIRARYMVACDGPTSGVRHKLGIRLTGDDEIARFMSPTIRAPHLAAMVKRGPAWLRIATNARRSGGMFAIDGSSIWRFMIMLAPGEHDFDKIDHDQAIRETLGVGADFEYELLREDDWVARRLLAERFQDRRVFLCGDAAHIWPPNAGYGMNAGIADADDLAWMLAAVINGWAPPALLDAWQKERHPITDQVSRNSMTLTNEMARRQNFLPAEFEEPGPAGDAARAAVGARWLKMATPQYCPAGLNFGYFYDASPIIAYDGEAAPAYTLGDYTPSTVPGCRVPHLWLRDGRSLYDALGVGFTLLRRDPVDSYALEEAARRRGVPFAVLDLASDEAAALYDRALVLARPDQHVAWRGDALPADPLALIDKVRGAA